VSAKYEGTYLEACTEDAPSFEVITTTIVGTTQTVRTLEFTDAACTVPASPDEEVVVESLVYPGGTVQAPLRYADFVDLTSDSVTLDGQPLSAQQIQEATQDGFFNSESDLFLFDGGSVFRGENSDLLDGEFAANRLTTLEADAMVRQ
jgi:hypothetical protein